MIFLYFAPIIAGSSLFFSKMKTFWIFAPETASWCVQLSAEDHLSLVVTRTVSACVGARERREYNLVKRIVENAV